MLQSLLWTVHNRGGFPYNTDTKVNTHECQLNGNSSKHIVYDKQLLVLLGNYF